MYSLSISLDCGPFTVTFFQKKAGSSSYSALDTSVFTVDQLNELFIKQASTNIHEAGVYELVYEVSLTSYSQVVSSQSAPFVYTVIDPCTAPLVTVTDQVGPAEYFYTGDDPVAAFTVAPFEI